VSRNQTLDLARYFVCEFIGRRWTPADYRSRHMKTASRLLKMGYDYDALVSALMALKERDYRQFGYTYDDLPSNIEGMEVLWGWGEPPLIERFLRPAPMPEIYSDDFDRWVRRWGKIAIERGDWDGIYLKRDPSTVPWLQDIIGTFRFRRSVKRWQSLARTSPPNKPSSGT
jgi:hypothetical protein